MLVADARGKSSRAELLAPTPVVVATKRQAITSTRRGGHVNAALREYVSSCRVHGDGLRLATANKPASFTISVGSPLRGDEAFFMALLALLALQLALGARDAEPCARRAEWLRPLAPLPAKKSSSG